MAPMATATAEDGRVLGDRRCPPRAGGFRVGRRAGHSRQGNPRQRRSGVARRGDDTDITDAASAAGGGFLVWITDRKNRRAIPHKMEQCGYVPVRHPDRKDGLWIVTRSD